MYDKHHTTYHHQDLLTFRLVPLHMEDDVILSSDTHQLYIGMAIIKFANYRHWLIGV